MEKHSYSAMKSKTIVIAGKFKGKTRRLSTSKGKLNFMPERQYSDSVYVNSNPGSYLKVP